MSVGGSGFAVGGNWRALLCAGTSPVRGRLGSSGSCAKGVVQGGADPTGLLRGPRQSEGFCYSEPLMDGPGSRWMIRNPAIFFSPSSTSIPLPPFPFSPTPATSPPPPPSPPKMASPSETTPLPELSATTTTASVDAKDEEKEIETARPAIAFPDEQEKPYHSTGAGFPRVGTTNTLRRQLTRDEKELANAGYEVPATEPTGHEVKQVDIVRLFFFSLCSPQLAPADLVSAGAKGWECYSPTRGASADALPGREPCRSNNTSLPMRWPSRWALRSTLPSRESRSD